MTNIRLIWHRRDLRLQDNALYQHASETLSLFVLDPALLEPRPCTYAKTVWTGPHAMSALLHALHGLRQSLRRERGSDLWVRAGDPAVVIPAMAQQMKATQVAWHVEPGWYEQQLSGRVQKSLDRLGIDCVLYTGCTLYHPDDLPQTPHEWKTSQSKEFKRSVVECQQQPMDCKTNPAQWTGVPPVMGNFRTACRNFASVRSLWSAPKNCVNKNAKQIGIDPGEIPTLEQLLKPILQENDRSILGLSQQQIRQICGAALKQHHNDFECRRGSEQWALERLDYFLFHHAATADRSRADVENNHSSKMSLPLALGTISPRVVYEKALQHNCTWLVSHLEMRDFFLYSALQAGPRLYQIEGLPVRASTSQWHSPQTRRIFWEKWSSGTTNLPLIDAGMRELQATGYCSNRVRQNCASFLSKDLEIDWRAGADLFQFLLEDHCVGANWGNWMYFSGVGSDPRNRHFRTISQALRYDPAGAYVSRWLDGLNDVVEIEAKFRPWEYLAEWGTPVVDPATQLTWIDSQRLTEKGHLCNVDDLVTNCEH